MSEKTGAGFLTVSGKSRNDAFMREGETRVPESLQYAYDKALEAQKIIRGNVKVGRTVGETLEVMVAALETIYVYHARKKSCCSIETQLRHRKCP